MWTRVFASLFGFVMFVLAVLVVVGYASWLWVNGPNVACTPQAAAAPPEAPPEWNWPAPWADPPSANSSAEAEEQRELPPVQAGGEDFALGVEELGGGWLRLREAANRDYCAWSFQFQLELDGLQAQFPHCVELRATGTGSLMFLVKPDSIGYGTSDTLGTGLAWWPTGSNGRYRVDEGEWVDLTTGPEGINFPLDGGTRTIQVSLDDGYVAIPLGEIRNNVMPRF